MHNLNFFLCLLFLFNCFFSFFSGLALDESYYWIYSTDLSFGYFDHPPMVGWLIKLGTMFWGKNELGVRFFFCLMQLGTITLAWDFLPKKNTNFLYYFLAFPLLMSSGILALPDTPLLFFSILFVKFFLDYLKDDGIKNVIKVSVVVTLLFYSKYHGILVVFFSLLAFPQVILRRSFWSVFLLSFAFYSPHLLWQFDHDFVTFKYHFFQRKQRVLELSNILNFFGGQLFLSAGLASFFVFWGALKKGTNEVSRLLKFNIWGLFFFLFLMSFRSKIEANWTITSSLFMWILFCQNLDTFSTKLKRFVAILFLPNIVAFFLLVLFIMFPQIAPKKFKRVKEFERWKHFAQLISKQSASGKIVANSYQTGAKLNFYADYKVPVLHHQIRKSAFSQIDIGAKYDRDEKITFLSYKRLENSLPLPIFYPFPLYLTETTINEIEGHE